MLLTALISGGFPFAFTMASMYMNYDTADYIFKNWLNNPMFWDKQTIYCTLAARAVLAFSAGLEISRSGGYFFMCLFLTSDQTSKVFECMKTLRFPIFAHCYTLVRIMHGKIYDWFNWLVYVFLATLFWGTVVSLYCVIMCFEDVTLVIYLGAIIAAVSLVLLQITIGPHVVDTFVMAKKVVDIQRTKVKIKRAQQRRPINFRNLKIAMAIRPIKILYGSFKTVDREFLSEHFDLLMSRIFDGIMVS